MKELLNALSATDLTEIFVSENVKADQLVNLNLEDLKMLGVSSVRAQRFLDDVKKEKGKQSLHQTLEKICCEELFPNLAKAVCTTEELISLDNDALKKFGFDLKQKKKLLTGIQKLKDANTCKYQM